MPSEDSLGEFQKQRCNEAEEIANRNMGARKQYSSINFHGGLIEGISLFLITNVHDFYTQCCFNLMARRASRIHIASYYFSSIIELLLKLSTMCKSPLHGPYRYVNGTWGRSANCFLSVYRGFQNFKNSVGVLGTEM